MRQDPNNRRDELDHKISRAVRAVRVGRPLPTPTPDEPSDDQLLLLIDNKLPADERVAVERRLQSCPYSADRVEILREALEHFERTRLVPDVAPEPEAADVAADVAADERGLVAQLVFGVARGVMSWLRGTDAPVALPALAVATRSASGESGVDSSSFYQFERRFGQWDATIQVESVPQRGMEVRLELRCDGTPLEEARAELRRRGKLLESVRVRKGVAGFTDLQADRYELAITQRETSIGKVTLDFVGA